MAWQFNAAGSRTACCGVKRHHHHHQPRNSIFGPVLTVNVGGGGSGSEATGFMALTSGGPSSFGRRRGARRGARRRRGGGLVYRFANGEWYLVNNNPSDRFDFNDLGTLHVKSVVADENGGGGGDSFIDGALTVAGNVNAQSDLTVSGNVDAQSDLNVAGTFEASGNVNAQSDLNVAGIFSLGDPAYTFPPAATTTAGQVLTASSADPSVLEWQTPSGGGGSAGLSYNFAANFTAYDTFFIPNGRLITPATATLSDAETLTVGPLDTTQIQFSTARGSGLSGDAWYEVWVNGVLSLTWNVRFTPDNATLPLLIPRGARFAIKFVIGPGNPGILDQYNLIVTLIE